MRWRIHEKQCELVWVRRPVRDIKAAISWMSFSDDDDLKKNTDFGHAYDFPDFITTVSLTQ